MSICRSCGVEVIWRVSANKRMPLNAEPDPERGNVVLLSGDGALVLGKPEATRRRAEGHTLYLSHFVTCPQRDEWRRNK